jgi:hypothetical protein
MVAGDAGLRTAVRLPGPIGTVGSKIHRELRQDPYSSLTPAAKNKWPATFMGRPPAVR